VIAYDTMWGSTEKMAHAMLIGVNAAGVEGRLYKLSVSDRSDVIAQVLQAKGLLLGSSTINRDILPTVAPFIEDIKGLRPQAKIGAAFGSYGWSGEAAKTLEDKLQQGGVQIVQPALTLKWVPNLEETQGLLRLWKEVRRGGEGAGLKFLPLKTRGSSRRIIKTKRVSGNFHWPLFVCSIAPSLLGQIHLSLTIRIP